jgi:hypothetical protein
LRRCRCGKLSAFLLKAHNIKESNEKEAIDSNYIAKVLAEDWGFWYTATTNLQNIRRFTTELDKLGPDAQITPSSIAEGERSDINMKINVLLKRIEGEPKSFGWKMRARVGTKKQWYNHVETPENVGGFGIWEAILRKGA